MDSKEALKLFKHARNNSAPCFQIIHAGAWRIVCEIARRYPGRFQVCESHPGGGQYDCLSLHDISESTHVLDMNMTGSLHIFKRWNGEEYRDDHDSYPLWNNMARSENPKDVVDAICALVGWPVPEKLPPPDADIIAYKFIAAFMAHAIFTRSKLRCSQGDIGGHYLDTNFSSHFSKFPAADKRRAHQTPEGNENAKYDVAGRFWFLCEDHEPVLCFELNGSGLAWLRDGSEFNLRKLYRKHKRIWPVIHEVAGSLL